ncbi:MAG: selenocysteine-specific translation elongation factor [Deltaproteobacteria bacterium]|nr:selenocysteine-specific translation elongation factor [Deltaproteobacteria bacterium]
MTERTAIIGTAGHVDHGKTSLVKSLTGMDTDRLSEEKRRGLTIDLGFAHMELPHGSGRLRAAIVDVPGHERFIRNMLAGVTGIDFVLFVIAADDGVMPQTREHLDIVRLLGVRYGIIVITKCDLVTGERVGEVKKAVSALVRGTVLEGAPIAPVSTVTGEGIEALKSLISARVVLTRERGGGPFFRLPVDRSFAIKGFGTVVTGTVASGSINKGDEALSFPSGALVKVRGIQSMHADADAVSAGERAALNIGGLNHREIGRGALLCSAGLKPFIDRAAKGIVVDCSFEFLCDSKSKAPLKDRSIVKVHHLTDETLAVIRLAAVSDGKAFGRLILKKPLLMLRWDRFIIRDPSRNSTVGGGTVVFPYIEASSAPKIKKLLPPCGPSDSSALRALMGERAAIDAQKASIMLNLSEKALSEALGDAYEETGGFVVDRERAGSLRKKIVETVAAHHAARPMDAGLSEDAIFSALKKETVLPALKARLFLKGLSEGLVSSKALKRDASALALPQHTPGSSGKDAEIEREILALFRNPFSPPHMEDIAKLKFKKDDTSRVMGFLVKKGSIVRLKEESFLSGADLQTARERLILHIGAKGPIKAAEFRDAIGCGRKLAIEILEHFDRERFTLRQGDLRILRK